jgi:hypothetical protein
MKFFCFNAKKCLFCIDAKRRNLKQNENEMKQKPNKKKQKLHSKKG